MKRLVRILIISLTLFSISLIIDSCFSKCEDYKFDYENFSIKTIKYTPESIASEYDFSDTCCYLFSQFGLRIQLKIKTYSYNTPNNMFINSAIAMDCWPTGYLQHKIEKIEIFTLNDFDEKHFINSNVSDVFLSRNVHSSVLEPVDTMINNYLNSTTIWDSDRIFDLILTKSPQLDSMFQFVVKIRLTNNGFRETKIFNILLHSNLYNFVLIIIETNSLSKRLGIN
jgi:hypothetical protein